MWDLPLLVNAILHRGYRVKVGSIPAVPIQVKNMIIMDIIGGILGLVIVLIFLIVCFMIGYGIARFFQKLFGDV
jgi:hypothetical protein